MSKPMISIIVPVYNMEEYLHRCLDSILNQSFKDYEILLIDDGSSDKSGQICDEYADRVPCVRVFHKENGGVSTARNLGLKSAGGEWVSFVDADDVLLGDGLEELVSHASDKVDMVWGGYEVYNENNELTYSITDRVCEDLTNEAGIEMLFSPRYYRYLGYSVGRLFRRSVIVSSGITFDEDVFYNEDRLFCTRFMCASVAGIRFTTNPVYGYIERTESAMGLVGRGFQPRFITDLTAMGRMRKVIRARYPDRVKINDLADSACYASWRRMTGMEGYSDSPFLMRAGVVDNLIKGLGFRRFVRYDWARNKKRIIKLIKKHI